MILFRSGVGRLTGAKLHSNPHLSDKNPSNLKSESESSFPPLTACSAFTMITLEASGAHRISRLTGSQASFLLVPRPIGTGADFSQR
jgi:hypothetical protein